MIIDVSNVNYVYMGRLITGISIQVYQYAYYKDYFNISKDLNDMDYITKSEIKRLLVDLTDKVPRLPSGDQLKKLVFWGREIWIEKNVKGTWEVKFPNEELKAHVG